MPGLAPNPEHCGCFAEIGGEECALVRSGGRLELESAAYERLQDESRWAAHRMKMGCQV